MGSRCFSRRLSRSLPTLEVGRCGHGSSALGRLWGRPALARHRRIGVGPAVMELFVPGRVCLFGEHTDWAGGFRRFNK